LTPSAPPSRTVPDLELEDFVVVSRRRERPIDTLDVDCPARRAEDVARVSHPSRRDAPVGPEAGRKIVLAVDYLHLPGLKKVDVLEQAKDMVEHGVSDNDEIMVVALTGGLRIEQPFTRDREKVVRALHRMEYDISLWNGNFTHVNEIGWVDGMTTLLDLLGAVPGNKAVVFYSAMKDVPLDLQFREIAAIAGASRWSIYPVDAWGLRTLVEDRAARPG
jgi:VWFA-related protein